MSWSLKENLVSSYMVERNNLVKHIIFTAVFCFLFITMYKPYAATQWVKDYGTDYVVVSLFVVIIAIIVLAVSRWLMYQVVKYHSLNYVEYIIWIVIELGALSGFYTLYAIAMRDDLSFWSWSDIAEVFRSYSTSTFMFVFMPYLASWLFFSNNDKKERLRNIEERLNKGEQKILQFKDEKGEVRFSLSSSSVVFVEAADNYVNINYVNNGKMMQYMLRNTLKKLQSQLEDTAIRRCHRSYMVNFEHVAALRKNGEEIDMEFDIQDLKKIPVSKTFSDDVLAAFVVFTGNRASQQ